ncbi:MAG: phosphopantetheine-binding protein [Bryobacteraceae bacterium]
MAEELTNRILDVIAATQKLARERVSIDSSFEELGIDSMDGVNILFALENEFDITIPDEQAKAIRSIRDIVEGVQKLIEGSGDAAVTS